jgi:hypothetical protein
MLLLTNTAVTNQVIASDAVASMALSLMVAHVLFDLLKPSLSVTTPWRVSPHRLAYRGSPRRLVDVGDQSKLMTGACGG